jgi:hypothetical protein
VQVVYFYDVDNSGMLTYKELIKDIVAMDRSWISYSEGLLLPITDYTARVKAPEIISHVGPAF